MELYASMTDLWLHTTDMLKSISDKVRVATDDHLCYTIYATDKENTTIGSVNKSYKSDSSHVKCVTVALRNNSFHAQIYANENETQILNKLSKVSERILKENMVILIENM